MRGSTIFVVVASSISEERVNFIWTVNRRKKICEADKRVSSYDNIDHHVQISSTVLAFNSYSSGSFVRFS